MPQKLTQNATTLINAIALNGATEAQRTATLECPTGNMSEFSMNLTDADSSITGITGTLWGSSDANDASPTWFRIPVLTTTTPGGAATYKAFSAVWDPSVDGKQWQWHFATYGNARVKLVLSVSGGSATATVDTITVTGKEYNA